MTERLLKSPGGTQLNLIKFQSGDVLELTRQQSSDVGLQTWLAHISTFIAGTQA